MDLPVKATILLNVFPDKTKVKEILRSHGFVLTGLSSDQVHVEGTFLKLKAAKASLELLLNSKTKTENAPYQEVTSGAISKYYAKNRSDLNQSQSGSRNKPHHASPSSPTASSPWGSDSPNDHPASFSPIPNQCGSFRRGRDSFVVDADVFIYADQFREKEIYSILESHNVRMERRQVGDSYNITLLGNSARLAAGKLQSLLDSLNKSLRTQDVPLKDMNRDGKTLLQKIRENKNIYNSVLVCAINDKLLHLIGPSDESYQLRQKLLGRPVGKSERTGRTSKKNSRARSSSLPPASRKNTERDRRAYPSPAKHAGYSPSKYQDDKQDGVEPERGAAAGFAEGGAVRRRSQSESREKTWAERTNGYMQESENKRPPPKSPMKGFSQLRMMTKDIKAKLKFWKY